MEELQGTAGAVVLDDVQGPEDYEEQRAEAGEDDAGGDHRSGAAVVLQRLKVGLGGGVVALAVGAGAGHAHLGEPGCSWDKLVPVEDSEVKDGCVEVGVKGGGARGSEQMSLQRVRADETTEGQSR